MKHAEVCPVCKGLGKYKEYIDYTVSTQHYIEKLCHGCQGKGWIEVTDTGIDNIIDYNKYNDFSIWENHIPHID